MRHMSIPSHYNPLMVIAAVMIAVLQVRFDVAALALEKVAMLRHMPYLPTTVC
jgi:hypothetical protein